MLIEARRPARQALRGELERAGFEILADVATIHGAESALRSMAPAVVVLDPDLPGVSAVDACRRIVAAAQNDAAVIVHARRGDAASVRAALDTGIHSYLVKTIASEGVLVAAIRRVAAGEAVLDPRAALALQRASLDEQPLRPPLSEREREVLVLVAEGLTNAA
ncbi:MAG: hypothetical protein QOE98_1387, partial [Gaiellaceae bacterium]|nr:hypothetical protein [Gaiellaceae bacterium]